MPPENASFGTIGHRPDVWKAVHQALRKEAIRATDAGTPLSLIILRIEDADQLGGPAGFQLRELLGEAARVVQAATDAEGLPWIYGTDRFVFILPDTKLVAARDKLETIRKSIFAPCEVDQGASAKIQLAVSIGAAEYRPKESLAHLIQRATEPVSSVERKLDRSQSRSTGARALGPKPLQGKP